MLREPPAALLWTATLTAALVLGGVAAAQPRVPVDEDTAAQPGLVPGTGLLDSPNPDVVMTLRGGVAVGPAYYGSDDYEVGPDASFRIDYLRLPFGLEFGSARTVGFQTGWGLTGSARYIGKRDSDDHEEIRGLDDIDWSFELGLGVGYEQRNYRAFASGRYGAVGHHAWVGEIGADGILYPFDGLTLTLGPRLDFGTRRFTDTYFGVSEAESGASGLEAFDPSGGIYSAGVQLGARYLINDDWGVEGAATWGRLVNDAADSPITREGSEDQYKVRIGLTRQISLDF